jgi:hypothetical protein
MLLLIMFLVFMCWTPLPSVQNADTHLDNNDAAADHDPFLRVLDFLLLYRSC